MKNTLILLGILFIAGCAPLSKWTQAQATCASDPACLAEAQKYANVGKAVAEPWGPIAVGAAGSCVLFVALGILGMKRKNDKG